MNHDSAAPPPVASILVIDDEPSNRRILSKMLEADGFVIVTAESGKEAVERLRWQHFDVAITDLVMPGMDGIQTLAALKQLDPELEVIILTGYGAISSATEALKHGACDYLQKPVGIPQLHASVTRAIELRRLNTAHSTVEVSRTLTKSANGEDLAISQFIKRKHVEEALRLTQFAVDHATDAVFWMDSQGRILYANEAACRSLGRSLEELLALSVPDIDPLLAQSGWETAWKEVKSRGSMTFETQHQTKDGRVFPVEISAKYLEFGGQEYSFTFVRDISERKRAEEALRASESHYRLLFENNVAAIIRNTMEGEITDCNLAAARTFGYGAPEELRGLNIRDLHWDKEKRTEISTRLQTEKTLLGRELKMRHKDGKPVWISVNLNLSPPDDNGRTFVLGTFTDITERKHTEEALRKSEAELKDALLAAQMGAWRWTRASDEVTWDDNLYRMAGRDPKLPPPSFQEQSQIYTPKSWKRLREAVEKALEGTPYELDLELLRPDGSKRWVIGRGEAQRDATGQITGLYGTDQDITDRAQAEEQLRKLSLAVEQSPASVVITDLQGDIEYVNPKFTTLTGYTREEAIGKNPRILKSGLQPPALYEDLWNTILAGGEWRGEFANKKKNGEIYWESASIVPIRDSAGVITHFLAVKEDITERKRAEQALAEAEEKYRSLVFNIPDVIWTVDASGHLAFVSPQIEKMSGYTLGEIEQRGIQLFLDSIHPDDAGRVRAAIKALFTRGEPYDVECRFRRKTGEWIWVQDRAVGIYERNGVRYADGRLSDITERKRFEEALRESGHFLQSSLDALSSHISILDEKGEIVAANEAWGQFAAAHGGDSRTCGLGANYLDVCRAAASESATAKSAFEGIRQVIAGSVGEFTLEYPCHSPEQKRWFLMRVTGFGAEGHRRAVLAHENITSRKLAEEALRESEVHYRLLFERNLAAVFRAAQGKMLEANDAAAHILGYASAKELIGLVLLDTFVDVETAHAIWAQLQEKKSLTNIEAHLKRKDGSTVWVLASLTRIGSEEGFETLVEGSYIDISKRKRAELALRETEERFRVMADGCPALMWVTDAEGKNQFVNRAYSEFCGLDNEQAVQADWQLHLHPEDAASYIAAFQQAVRNHAPFRAEARLRRADGEWRWVVSHAAPRFSQSGEYLGHAGISPDITERKQVEQALQSSEEKFRQLAETLREAFWMRAPAGNELLYISPAYEQIWGRSCESLYQNPVSSEEAIHPEDLEQARSVFARQMQGEPLESIYRISAPDGKEKWIRDRAFPARDPEGRLTRIIGVAEDITGSKQAEEELRKAKEAAEAASRAKSQFLANMSHEIRTPMNGVIGMAGMLLDTELTPEQRRYAEVVRSSGEALLKVINEILDFSKIEARKVTLEVTDFDLSRLLEQTVEMLAPSAVGKGLELTCLVAEGTPSRLRGDPARLRQILLNLAGNAIKFTKTGEVNIRVRLDVQDQNSLSLRFAVEDTGIGVAKDRVGALFSPFVQADGSTTRRYGGTGLGLTISKQLVKLMGGEIGLESEEGQGSTFWFTVVLQKQAEADPVETGSASEIQGVKVLVVDDNATSRRVAGTILKSWGCRASQAADGISALDCLRKAARLADPFEAALIDVGMPGMDGQELARQIFADPDLAATRVLLMTSPTQDCRKARVDERGVAGYVIKPIMASPLREALYAGLGKKTAGQEPSSGKTANSLAPTPVLSNARILVAEDVESNREVALAILSKLGCRTDLVANGAEAVASLQSVPYDLVLMDCEMPEMDGYEATRQIRQWERTKGARRVPILALTAHAISGEKAKCLEAGMDDYIPKPIEPRTMAAALQEWLHTSSATARLSAPPNNAGGPAHCVFNEAEMLERLMGDRVLAGKVIAGFLHDTPLQLRNLEERVTAGDAEESRRRAHALKGAAATVSAPALREAALQVEETARAADWERARQLLCGVKEKFEQFRMALQQAGWA